jgi:uncharacterized protein (DUF924 family)
VGASVPGACLCRSVRFEITLPSVFCLHCHCSICRRHHGAAYVTWVGVARERLRVTQGADAIVGYPSSAHGTRSFCGRCGSSLFCESALRPAWVDVVRAALDGPLDRGPERHFFFDDRVAWAPVDDELPRHGGASGIEPYGAETLLAFWFGNAPLCGAALERRMQAWFTPDAAFDAELRARFAPLVREAALGALDAWAQTPRGRLALILLLDQLPRNLFRGEARAFATDPQALAWSLSGIEAGLDRALAPLERTFFYLPLQHAEDLSVQERSVEAFAALAREAEPPLRGELEGHVAYAVRHRDLIARFGRFPHRNRALGRASTRQEEQHLAADAERFGQ